MSIIGRTNAIMQERQRMAVRAAPATGKGKRDVRGGGRAPAGPDPQGTTVSQAISALTRYIPGEAMTLYLAAIAALGALQSSFQGFQATTLYWIFVVITPLLWLLVYFGQERAMGATLPRYPIVNIIWELFAATAAFAAWALALTPSPFFGGPNQGPVAALIVVATSILLGLIGTAIDRLQKTP